MAPASSSEAGGKPSASSKPSSPVAAPGIDESRGGIKNPFYDHRPNAVPITDTGEKLAYYAITYPIAVARAAVTFGTIFIYLLYVLSVMPLLLWMRKRAPRPDGPDGQPPSALIYNLLLLWPGRMCGFFVTLGLGFRVKVRRSAVRTGGARRRPGPPLTDAAAERTDRAAPPRPRARRGS